MQTTLRTVNDIDNVSADFTIPEDHEFRVVNVDAPTATITIPVGLPIGYQRLIRKVNSNQGTITITSSGGEIFTSLGESSLSILEDGDIIYLEKATSGRWELLSPLRNKTQIKALSSDVNNNNVVLSDLTFNNLKPGKWYRVFVTFDLGSSSGNAAVNINHSGSTISRFVISSPTRFGASVVRPFKATSDKLTFRTIGFDSGDELRGNGTVQSTHATLEELNGGKPIETTDF